MVMTKARPSSMLVLRSLAVCVFGLQPALPQQFEVGQSSAWDARSLAEQALQKARDGKTEEALAQFRQALQLAPNSVPILRDYAIVLGWGGHYKDAITVIRQVSRLERQQPDWALREFARSYLFGDETAAALQILDELVARGDTSEPVLLRRGLALRWLGRPREAQAAYEAALEVHPKSGATRAGIVYSLGDQNRLSDALRAANTGLDVIPGDPDLLKAKIRILNWMGRHLEAQEMLDAVPPSMSKDKEIMEDRVAAARWGGDPVTAAQTSHRLNSAFPDNDAVKNLDQQLEREYGYEISSGYRYVSDSDGFIDRTWSGEFGLHLTPAQELRVGYMHREFTQTQSELWQRYDLGWTGILSRRVQAYATVANVNYYLERGVTHKIIGDAALSFAASDRVRITAGGGTIAMDAFEAVQNRVTAPFAFGDMVLTPNYLTRFETRYTHFDFSDGVTRDRVDLEGLRQIYSRGSFRLRLGERSNLMWHDRYTPDFYSPSSFQSHLGFAQVEGRITSSLSYWVEAGGGWQKEPGTPWQNPLQLSGKFIWRPTEGLRILIEAGRTTSSLERVIADRTPYSRRYSSVGLEYQFR
jgi:tetratricopeptide (TPR) repeat protein